MPVRVIAGSARGRALRRPAGSRTRPTSARLREAMFAMLDAAGADLSCVLDLYAGTGALGIEALSRGEGRATFVEADRRAAAVLRENLRSTQLVERARVVTAPVGRWRPRGGQRYTLVVADPPYDDAAAWGDIAHAVRGALDGCCLLAVEHSARAGAPATLAGLERWRDRRHGDGSVAIYRAQGGAASPQREGMA